MCDIIFYTLLSPSVKTETGENDGSYPVHWSSPMNE